MNFFKVLMSPDQEEKEQGERMIVAKAANLLQVGEFQLLQLAYAEWHGEELGEEMSSFLFKSYMIEHQVPPWARHYARKIIALSDDGQLDDREPDYHRYDRDYHENGPRGLKAFCVASAVCVFMLVGGLMLADKTATKSATLLPPYFGEDELKISDQGNQSSMTWGRSDTIPPHRAPAPIP
jgi:hypothetical protein